MALIDTIAKYHALSKAPVENNTSLANVRNKSGHTVTSQDVWAENIPAFFEAFSSSDFDLYKPIAEENDLIAYGNDLYYLKIEDGVKSWTPREALVDGEYLFNSSAVSGETKIYNDGILNIQASNISSIKPVMRYHSGLVADILEASNNSGTPSQGYSIRVKPTGGKEFLSSFVSSMDKVVGGYPSTKLAPVVHDTTSSSGLCEEGTDTNNCIINTYGGLITFNRQRNDAETTITVDVFEYVGKKVCDVINELDTKIDTIEGLGGDVGNLVENINEIKDDVTLIKGEELPKIRTSISDIEGDISALEDAVSESVKSIVVGQNQEDKQILIGRLNDEVTFYLNLATAVEKDGDGLVTSGLLSSAIENAAITVNDKEAVKSLTIVGTESGDIPITVTPDTTAADGTQKLTISASTTSLAKKSDAISANITSDSDNTYVGGSLTLDGTLNNITGSITIDDSKLQSVLSKTLSENDTWKASDTETSPSIKVSLGGSVENPNISVEASDIASASALSNLSNRVESIASAGINYKVVTTLPTTLVAEDKGYIYLILNEDSEDKNIYDEYIVVENNGNYALEKIGTTKTELTGYITQINLNGLEYTVNEGTTIVDLPNLVKSISGAGISSFIVGNDGTATMNLTSASTNAAGIVQLSDSTSSTSSSTAATSKAVNEVLNALDASKITKITINGEDKEVVNNVVNLGTEYAKISDITIKSIDVRSDQKGKVVAITSPDVNGKVEFYLNLASSLDGDSNGTGLVTASLLKNTIEEIQKSIEDIEDEITGEGGTNSQIEEMGKSISSIEEALNGTEENVGIIENVETLLDDVSTISETVEAHGQSISDLEDVVTSITSDGAFSNKIVDATITNGVSTVSGLVVQVMSKSGTVVWTDISYDATSDTSTITFVEEDEIWDADKMYGGLLKDGIKCVVTKVSKVTA